MSAVCTVPSSGSQRWASTTIPVIQSGKVTRVNSSARLPVQGRPISRPCATTCSHLNPWRVATTRPDKPKSEEISLKRWGHSREVKRLGDAIWFIGSELAHSRLKPSHSQGCGFNVYNEVALDPEKFHSIRIAETLRSSRPAPARQTLPDDRHAVLHREVESSGCLIRLVSRRHWRDLPRH